LREFGILLLELFDAPLVLSNFAFQFGERAREINLVGIG
jgi:hypothetical protein